MKKNQKIQANFGDRKFMFEFEEYNESFYNEFFDSVFLNSSSFSQSINYQANRTENNNLNHSISDEKSLIMDYMFKNGFYES